HFFTAPILHQGYKIGRKTSKGHHLYSFEYRNQSLSLSFSSADFSISSSLINSSSRAPSDCLPGSLAGKPPSCWLIALFAYSGSSSKFGFCSATIISCLLSC